MRGQLCSIVAVLAVITPSQLFAQTYPFEYPVGYSVGYQPGNLWVEDFNNDQYPDVVTPNSGSADISILINNGYGIFLPAVNYACVDTPNSAYSADLESDGDNDIIVICNGIDSVLIYRNNGNGVFQPFETYPLGGSAPCFIAGATLNADAYPDLLVLCKNPGSIKILMNNGNGNFLPSVSYDALGEPYAAAVADFDGNGDVDVACTRNWTDNIIVLYNNGDGTFQAPVTYPALWTGVGMGICTGDFNSDSYPDLAVTIRDVNCISIMPNDGNGAFPSQICYGTGVSFPISVVSGDFYGVGNQDLAVGSMYNGAMGMIENRGNGDFVYRSMIGSVRGNSLFRADFDNDGFNDLVASTIDAVNVFLNSHLDTLHVSTNGNDTTGNGTRMKPYKRIQTGIQAAQYWETVLVWPGTYYEHLNFIQKPITVKSQSGAESTFIEKRFDGVPIVNFISTEDSTSVFDGFTVRNSSSVGIYCSTGGATIKNCIIENNAPVRPDYQGGGICVLAPEHPIRIMNNIIRGNSAVGGGGGIYLRNRYNGNASIIGNQIYSNAATGNGGGLNVAGMVNGFSVYVDGNRIFDNNALNGGGLFIGTMVFVTGDSIHQNNAERGGGIYIDAVGGWGQISNNTIHDNYASIEGASASVITPGYSISKNVIFKNICAQSSGGIVINGGASIIGNTITENISGLPDIGGGVWVKSGAWASLNDNIIAFNQGYGVYRDLSAGVSIDYSCVYGNQSGEIFGVYPGYYCIFEDPLFLDRYSQDYSLTANSPCIDAGGPYTPDDPDSTLPDMGAIYFDQRYRLLDFHLLIPAGDSILVTEPSQYIWHSTTDFDSGYQVYYKFLLDDNMLFDLPPF